MGGIALGEGVASSGLLEVLHTVILDLLYGVSLYNVVLILSPVVLVRPRCRPFRPSHSQGAGYR
jgi:phosphate transporter